MAEDARWHGGQGSASGNRVCRTAEEDTVRETLGAGRRGSWPLVNAVGAKIMNQCFAPWG